MAAFFAMATGFDPGPTFLRNLLVGTAVVGAFLVLLFIPARSRYQYNHPRQEREAPPPKPPKPEYEEVTFTEIKGTQWTRNFKSNPDAQGRVVALFIRRMDGDKRILEEREQGFYFVYTISPDNTWVIDNELEGEQALEYIETWAKK
jgi:hypothetical protein